MFGGSGGMSQPHTPTMGWTIALVVIILLGYHFFIGKK